MTTERRTSSDSSAEASALTRADKELIAVAASLAAGCIPCTAHHAHAVREAGASEQDARWAAGIGLAVRRHSLAVMSSLAAEHFGTAVASDADQLRDDGYVPELAPLVGVAAATAADCVPALEHYIDDARAAEIAENDIRRALGIGRVVRETAARKADEAAIEAIDSQAGNREEVAR